MAGLVTMLRHGAAAAAVLLGTPLAAAPDTFAAPEAFDLRSFTCPLGGEKFSHDVGYSAYPLLTLPDGSWLGDYQISTQVPTCPGNGLVIVPNYDPYKPEADGGGQLELTEYSPGELARLPALIADPAYRQLKADGAYAQAYWLASQLGRPAYGRFHLLQRATWATTDPVLRRRLIERFVAEAPALIEAAAVPVEHKAAMQLFVVNALRELSRFDEAQAMLTKFDPDTADEASTAMVRAVQQRDDGWFAAETMPAKMFGDLCRGELTRLYGPLKPATKAACKVREMREAQQEREQEAAFAESSELKQNLPALRSKCTTVPVAKRSAGLTLA